MPPILPEVKGPTTRHHPDLDRRSAPFVLIIPPPSPLTFFQHFFNVTVLKKKTKFEAPPYCHAVPTSSSFVFAQTFAEAPILQVVQPSLLRKPSGCMQCNAMDGHPGDMMMNKRADEFGLTKEQADAGVHWHQLEQLRRELADLLLLLPATLASLPSTWRDLVKLLQGDRGGLGGVLLQGDRGRGHD